MNQDTSWASDMDEHCQSFRLIWSEYGLEYLFGENDFTPHDPLYGDPPTPDGHSVPTPGTPVYPDNAVVVPPEILQQWQQTDDEIVDLYQNHFLSGHLEPATEVVKLLSQAPLGTVNLDENRLEGKDTKDIGESASRHIQAVRTRVQDWSGAAAHDFDIHLNRLEYAIAGCQDRMAAAWRVIAQYKRALQDFRGDILNLVQDTHDHIDEAIEVDKRTHLNFLQTMGSAGAAAIAIPVAGEVTAAALAYIAVCNAIAAGGTGDQVLRVGAQSRGEIIVNMVDGGKKIVEDARQGTELFTRACYSVTDHLTGEHLMVGDDLEGVRSKRPKLVTDDKFDPDGFRLPGHSDQDLADVSREDLVEEPKRNPDQDRDHHIKNPYAHDDDNGDARQPDAYPEQGAAAGSSGGKLG